MRRIDDTRRTDGAVAIILAISLVVVFGMGALVVDIGALYFERRELQNGADAAALAVAQDCASGDDVADCDAGPFGDRYETADEFANVNAADNASDVADDATGVEIDYAAARVTVTATTLNDGDGVVRTALAPVLGFTDRGVAAESIAIWGPVAYGSIGTLPLTFSQCEYDKFLAAGAGSADEPWTVANNGDPSIIYVHGNAEPCNASTSGYDIPGGFGWLETPTNSECGANIENEWVGVDPGASPSTGCDPVTVFENVFEKVVLIPVFDNDNGLTGANAEYHMYTYAAFYVTGYYFGSHYKQPADNPPCSGSDRCIAGWFTTSAAVGGTVDPTAPNLGVNTVQLVLN